MNSHNTKSSFVFHKTPATTEADKEDAEVVSTTLTSNTGLSIADDADAGSDPYNNTGQHVVLEAKMRRKV